MENKKLRNKGFTLVELIIVVAIIAVLAAVLAPQYLRYVERARESNDLQIATSLMRAATVAVADPQNGIPTGRFIEFLWATSDNNSDENMGILLVRYPHSTGGAGLRTSIFNDSSSSSRLPALSSAEASVDKLSEATIATMGGEIKSAADVGQGLKGTIGDAQSKIANETNFCFHVNTTTGEIALAKLSGDGDVNDWLELGIDAIPAP